jgi:hypothetical protein
MTDKAVPAKIARTYTVIQKMFPASPGVTLDFKYSRIS